METMLEDGKRKRLTSHLQCRTALELWQEKQTTGAIVTFSEHLDTMFDGGVQLGRITEICGVPGVGKTQLCMQLAVDTHIPENLGGQEGEVVYIDTEGALVAERFEDMAWALVHHCTRTASHHTQDEEVKPLTVDKILSGIHTFRCMDHNELIATVHLLKSFLKEHPKVKIVIIDSVAAPFRSYVEDLSQRTRLLAILSQNLLQLASDHKVAIVLTNQMTTRIQGSLSSLIPALGESWGHCCASRLLLHWCHGKRKASLFKSDQPETSCPFTVTHDGIRDLFPETEHLCTTTQNVEKDNSRLNTGSVKLKCHEESSVQNPVKRQKMS